MRTCLKMDVLKARECVMLMIKGVQGKTLFSGDEVNGYRYFSCIKR